MSATMNLKKWRNDESEFVDVESEGVYELDILICYATPKVEIQAVTCSFTTQCKIHVEDIGQHNMGWQGTVRQNIYYNIFSQFRWISVVILDPPACG